MYLICRSVRDAERMEKFETFDAVWAGGKEREELV